MKLHFKQGVYYCNSHTCSNKPHRSFDLIHALALPNDATKVLGDQYSLWRTKPLTGLDYISGSLKIPESEIEMGDSKKSFSTRANSRRIEIIRNQLDISDDTFVFLKYTQKCVFRKTKNQGALYFDDAFVQNHNPYIRTVVRRTRKIP